MKSHPKSSKPLTERAKNRKQHRYDFGYQTKRPVFPNYLPDFTSPHEKRFG